MIDTLENRAMKDAILYVLLDNVDVDIRIEIEAEYRKRIKEYDALSARYKSASVAQISENNFESLKEIL